MRPTFSPTAAVASETGFQDGLISTEAREKDTWVGRLPLAMDAAELAVSYNYAVQEQGTDTPPRHGV